MLRFVALNVLLVKLSMEQHSLRSRLKIIYRVRIVVRYNVRKYVRQDVRMAEYMPRATVGITQVKSLLHFWLYMLSGCLPKKMGRCPLRRKNTGTG